MPYRIVVYILMLVQILFFSVVAPAYFNSFLSHGPAYAVDENADMLFTMLIYFYLPLDLVIHTIISIYYIKDKGNKIGVLYFLISAGAYSLIAKVLVHLMPPGDQIAAFEVYKCVLIAIASAIIVVLGVRRVRAGA